MNQNKQSTLWLLAALAAPIAHFSGSGWLTASLTAAAILPLFLLPRSWEDLPKPLAYLEVLWLGTVAGLLLPASAVNWPSDNAYVVPLTILSLAILTNAAAAPRIGAVLVFCMAILAIPVTISAAAHIEPAWLLPTATPWSPYLALTLLLSTLPMAGERRRDITYTALLTIALTVLNQGVLSPQVAANLPDPFYQTARTLGHLEPIAAAGLTLGWYALTTFLLQSAAEIARNAGIGRMWASVLVSATPTFLVLFPQQPNGNFVLIISVFLWLIAPFVRKINVFEKSEK